MPESEPKKCTCSYKTARGKAPERIPNPTCPVHLGM
jgi:hypothetical protein